MFTFIANAYAFLKPIIGSLLLLLGSLGLFLYGMRLMSDGLQKASGDQLEKFLNSMTSNRYTAVFTGFLVTALIQSSSATTVMTVSFVNAGLLSLQQSIGIIMGANIGTTITGWLVSLLGFKVSISSMALPAIGVGLILFFSKKKTRNNWGEFLIGFGLLFLGLSYMKDVFERPGADDIKDILIPLTDMGYLSYVIFIAIGTILTIVVHSSSAAMGITLTMAFNGYLPFDVAAAMLLGCNIGTTVDAFLASIGAKVNAKRAAFVHICFNVIGSLLALLVFRPYLWLSEIIIDAFRNLIHRVILIFNSARVMPDADITTQLAAFHTLFNILNTLIFIWFIPQIAAGVKKLIKEKEAEIGLAKYVLDTTIGDTMQNTFEFHFIRSRKEVQSMSEIVKKMFDSFTNFIRDPLQSVDDVMDDVKAREEYTDDMEEQLTRYLLHFSGDSNNEEDHIKVGSLLRIVNELESIGDCCYSLMTIARKKQNKNIELHENALTEIKNYSKLVEEFLDIAQTPQEQFPDEEIMERAYTLEEKLSKKQKKFVKRARKSIAAGADIKGELLYIDIMQYLEHIGDYCLNIVEALRETVRI